MMDGWGEEGGDERRVSEGRGMIGYGTEVVD